ncbi:folate family ECF transporter S component [Vagococcus coleopterorum]|uniref:Folate family ECF transporter S component n=1 Tax=Vagococcus coleopterorum TaxID=2714946 RepID=A0A6G8ALN9_9ENTE|nr:folate family ECF transporter S component [Vagococcus coleopterorum]QIL45879.1 folate family ECF transporter S component [Vagococcus coleopterorum]
MNKRKMSTRTIALMGILMAMQIILTRFLSIQTPFVRIGFTFVPIVIMSMMFNPWITGVGTLLADFVGIIVFGSTGPYFPGFSLSALLTGLVYSFFFYKKEMSLKRIIVASLIVGLVIELGLNTVWLYMIAPGPGVLAQVPLRLGKAAILIPIKIFVIYLISHNQVMQNQIKRFRS